jgi:hypothetical protein
MTDDTPQDSSAPPTQAVVTGPKQKMSPEEVAVHALKPALHASITLLTYMNHLKMDGRTLTKEIEKISTLKDGDLSRASGMLMGQTHILDVLFNRLCCMALEGRHNGKFESGYLEMALKVQKQCRNSIETLKVLRDRNAPAVSIQQNIAQNQQINNGVTVPALEGGKNSANELLTHRSYDHEALDAGRAATAAGTDSELEAVGVVVRAEDA